MRSLAGHAGLHALLRVDEVGKEGRCEELQHLPRAAECELDDLHSVQHALQQCRTNQIFREFPLRAANLLSNFSLLHLLRGCIFFTPFVPEVHYHILLYVVVHCKKGGGKTYL